MGTDLAFGRTDLGYPRFAYPYVTADSKLTTDTLEKLILVAYSRDDLDEPCPTELAQHRATAKATADIVLNPAESGLSAVTEVAQDRLVDCLPAYVRSPDGIRIRLYDEPGEPVKTEICSPTSRACRQSKPTRERTGS